MKKTFGENLAALRKQAGLSQEQLAGQLNLSRQAVSNWERGLSEPDMDTLGKIAGLLQVSVSDLMGTPGQEGARPAARLSPALTLADAALAAVHLVLGLCGRVNLFAVTALPLMCAFIQITIYLSFTSMLKSGNYDMLAGFDARKDSIRATQLQMGWIALLSGLTALLVEVLFIGIYFAPPEKQMNGAMAMMAVYFAVEILCVITVQIKSQK